MVKKDASVITNEKKAVEITEVVKAEKVMAEDACDEDVRAEDGCVENIKAVDVMMMMAEDMRVENIRAESEREVAQGKETVDQGDEGDITDTVSEDCEENIAHDECMLKVSILDIV